MTTAPDATTEEGFIVWLKSENPIGFSIALSNFTEADRKKLSKCAQKYAQQVRKAEREARSFRGLSVTEAMQRAQNFMNSRNKSRRSIAMAHIGLLAVGPKSSVMWNLPNTDELSTRSTRDDLPSDYERAAIDVLLSRRPDWAQEWFERQLISSNFGIGIGWSSVKRLFEAQLCHKPDSVEFARFIYINALGMSMRCEPMLVEMIWDQFQFNTGFWRLNGKFREFSDTIPKNVWLAGPERIYHWIAQGMLERSKVIDSLLQALWRDFGVPERLGMIKLYEALNVTADEILSRQSEHCRLLTHEAANVVALGLKCLKAIRQQASFDVDAAIDNLACVMSIRTKSQPIAALGLLKVVAGTHEPSLSKSVRVASLALQHLETDVQTAAVELLEQWSQQVVIPKHLLDSAVNTLSSTLRPRIQKLLAHSSVAKDANQLDSLADSQSGSTDSGAMDATLDDNSRTIEELHEALAGLPEGICSAFKLPESLQAAISGTMLPEIDMERVPFAKKALVPVVPIRDMEELIDTINALAENIDSSINVERVLDGIQVMGKNYPDDFDIRVAPILNRLSDSNSHWAMYHPLMSFPRLVRLLVRWMQRFKGPIPGHIESSLHRSRPEDSLIMAAIDDRLDDIESRVSNDAKPLPLLALPTHEHGWIEPSLLLERLRAYFTANEALPVRELETAILRLTPHARFSTSALADFPDSLQRILLYASGEAITFTAADQETTWSWLRQSKRNANFPAQLWLAAGRHRQVRAALPELALLRIPEVAFGASAARVKWNLGNSSAAREQAEKEVTKLRQALGYANVQKVVDPNEPGLEAAEIERRVRLKAALTSDAIGNGSIVEFEPSMKGPAKLNCIPIALANRLINEDSHYARPWAHDWFANFRPSNCDGCFVVGLSQMHQRYDENSSSMTQSAAIIAPLLWPEAGWSDLALQTIWFGIMCKSADVNTVAKDALIEGILDARAQPIQLAKELRILLNNSWLKLNRLADALDEVSRISLWATLVVTKILDEVMQSWSEVPRDGHQLLSTQLEGLSKLQTSPSANATEALKQLKPTGKATKLVASLLKLKNNPQSTSLQAALLEGVLARVRRARWCE